MLMLIIVVSMALLAIYANAQRWSRNQIEAVIKCKRESLAKLFRPLHSRKGSTTLLPVARRARARKPACRWHRRFCLAVRL